MNGVAFVDVRLAKGGELDMPQLAVVSKGTYPSRLSFAEIVF